MAGAFRSLVRARLAIRQTVPESARTGRRARSGGPWFRPVLGAGRLAKGKSSGFRTVLSSAASGTAMAGVPLSGQGCLGHPRTAGAPQRAELDPGAQGPPSPPRGAGRAPSPAARRRLVPHRCQEPERAGPQRGCSAPRTGSCHLARVLLGLGRARNCVSEPHRPSRHFTAKEKTP